MKNSWLYQTNSKSILKTRFSQLTHQMMRFLVFFPSHYTAQPQKCWWVFLFLLFFIFLDEHFAGRLGEICFPFAWRASETKGYGKNVSVCVRGAGNPSGRTKLKHGQGAWQRMACTDQTANISHSQRSRTFVTDTKGFIAHFNYIAYTLYMAAWRLKKKPFLTDRLNTNSQTYLNIYVNILYRQVSAQSIKVSRLL